MRLRSGELLFAAADRFSDDRCGIVRGSRDQLPVQERWLFPSRKSAGKPITTRHLNRLFHEAADAAAIKKGVTLHTLRHSFATHLLEDDTHIRKIRNYR